MKYHSITHYDMCNGDGLRTVLWVSGCTHACHDCHNQITWDPKCGLDFDSETKDELFDTLSGAHVDGLTLSGGDPLHYNNVKDILKLVKEVKEKLPTKTIWLYTGYCYEDISDQVPYMEILKYVDILVDGPYVKQLHGGDNLKWRGSSNQRVIDVQKTIENNHNIALHCE